MKIGTFIAKKNKPLLKSEILLCDKAIDLNFTENSIHTGRNYAKTVENIPIVGMHNYWGTMYKTRHFKANVKSLKCYVMNKKDLNGIEQYSLSFKVYGDFKYKYQRGICENVEVYSYYDYDTDLSELLNRMNDYYTNLIKDFKK